ncbi:uncharacterized protein [Antedon mediterranea]|uniref:uncharacterized protein n=1 Tax=Antedon mediterranea TaxID=105859 RepID=UPI003AF4E06F
MININRRLYLAIANSKDTVTGSSVVNSGLYLYRGRDKSFVLKQSFVTQGAVTVLFIEHDDYDPWLVFANYYDSELETGLTTTDIYQWSGNNFELQHQISGEYIVDVVSIKVNGQPCVVSASERNNYDATDYYMPVVTVCFEDEQWAEITEFEGQGVIGLDSFSVDGTPYLVVLSQFDEIHVYKWCGISGFEMYLNIPYSDVNSVNVFMYDGSLLMGVARFFVSEIADQVGDTRILKGIINGLKEDTIIEA